MDQMATLKITLELGRSCDRDVCVGLLFIFLDISNVEQVPGWQFSVGARVMFLVEVAGAN